MKKRDDLLRQADSLREQIDASKGQESRAPLLLRLVGALEGLRNPVEKGKGAQRIRMQKEPEERKA